MSNLVSPIHLYSMFLDWETKPEHPDNLQPEPDPEHPIHASNPGYF